MEAGSLRGKTTDERSTSQGEIRPVVRIVDDDPAVLESLAHVVRAMQLEPICFASAQEFLKEYDGSVPGCVILDIQLPGMDGLDLQECLNGQSQGLPVVIISGHATVSMTVRAWKQGAVEFLEKPYPPQELRAGIRRAVKRDAQRRHEQKVANVLRERIRLLTESEKAVLAGVLDGYPSKKIAAELDLSLRTVQLRRSSIMKKLNVRSTVEMVKLVSWFQRSEGQNWDLPPKPCR